MVVLWGLSQSHVILFACLSSFLGCFEFILWIGMFAFRINWENMDLMELILCFLKQKSGCFSLVSLWTDAIHFLSFFFFFLKHCLNKRKNIPRNTFLKSPWRAHLSCCFRRPWPTHSTVTWPFDSFYKVSHLETLHLWTLPSASCLSGSGFNDFSLERSSVTIPAGGAGASSSFSIQLYVSVVALFTCVNICLLYVLIFFSVDCKLHGGRS